MKDLVPYRLTGSLDPEECWVVAQALVIPLVIRTIRQDPSGSVWIDEASNLSRADPSGADQIDAEYQATDLAVGGVRIPCGAPPSLSFAAR
jgi:hypothetical protein